MNAPSVRMTRHLAGPLAAGLLAGALVAGAPAQAADLPERDCGPYLSDVSEAKADLPVAKDQLADARVVLERRTARYEARPTKKNRRAMVVAERAVTEAKYALANVKYRLTIGRERVEVCEGPVGAKVTRVRVDPFDGSVLGNVLWNMPSDFTYYQFMRSSDPEPQFQGDRVFDDYDVDPAPGDDRNHVPNSRLINGYTFGGCDFLPGETLTLELWTGVTGEETPAGELAYSKTIDNPCR
ncbi:hypothetical protein [Nocardioides sp. AX2bis]|uniref:hypothetical protein n=1 Tax=Nocardioides sp. AX2bis TaxID=2653157 RepID=UPI0012F3DF12|nr:hypothetical protein [Nocardioides sp. AX2bis]VXB68349.1 exported hypothetical protein [Nocardioides sp. AX2bis]